MINIIIEKSIELASDKLNIPEPRFKLINSSSLDDSNITCVFNKDNNIITYSRKWILSADEIEIIIATFHEVRHSYQFYSVINNINETEKKLQLWKENFNNYKTPTINYTSSEDKEYLLQPIEKDAIVWTHKVIKELFDIKTKLPEVIKALILKEEVWEVTLYPNLY